MDCSARQPPCAVPAWTGSSSATVWRPVAQSPTPNPLRSRSASPRRSAAPARPARSASSPRSIRRRTSPVAAVRFFVDNVLLGEAKKGPPWGIDWTDENPFEAREIRAEAVDANGHTADDSVLLKPLEVIEHAQVSSVYVETAVQDKAGRFVTGMGPVGLSVVRRRRAADAGRGASRAAARDVHHPHRHQPEHGAAHRFRPRRRRPSGRLSAREGPDHRRAVRQEAPDDHRTDGRSHDGVGCDRGDSTRRRHRDPRFGGRGREAHFAASKGGTRSSC